MSELIIIEGNVPLTTSYKIAEELGIKHRSLMQLLKDHKAQIEKHFGVLRFENAKPLRGSLGGRPEQYSLLTENQANYVLMLSGNTEKSMEVKALFVKAFAEAKEVIAQLLANQQPSAIPFNKDVQNRCIANEKLLPQGYWCVVNEMYKEALVVIPFQKELKDWSLPDGSCGRKWRSYCTNTSINISQSVQIPLWVPNLKKPADVWIYPYDLLDTFRGWLRVEYAEYYEHQYLPSRLKDAKEIDKPKKRGWLR